MTPFRERTLTSFDGLRLYYRDYGAHDGKAANDAVPALCLPGLTRNSRDFDGLAMRLSKTRRVICPDYRGRGRSDYDPHWRNYEPRIYLDDLRHLLVALNIHEFVAIGTSLGGLIAVGLALVVPGALRAIILNDVGPEVQTSGFQRILVQIRSLPPQPSFEQAARYLRQNYPKLSIADDAGWIDFARATYHDGKDGMLVADWDPAILKPLLVPFDLPFDLWKLYRAVAKVPMLAVRGGASDVLSEQTFRRMKAEKPDLIQVTVPGIGHAPSLTEPAVWNAIEEFLEPI